MQCFASSCGISQNSPDGANNMSYLSFPVKGKTNKNKV